VLITNQNELDQFCSKIKTCEFITIDTEFLREKTYYPKLCLIQIGTPEGDAVAIDPLEGNLDISPVYDLLLDKNILKIIHAGRQDLEIFFKLTGKVVHPFFDTQIAAMVCGYGDSVGYESLVRNITGATLDKSVQFTNWAIRPLSKKQLDYALGDVTHLVQIYIHLAAELEKRGRISWVYQEEGVLSDPATYENHPENAWKRIKVKSPKPKTLAILRELAKWREKKAQERDIPRPWIIRDDTLADMAAQAPKTTDQLKKIRNMSADAAKGHTGELLLDLIKKALESDKKTWPKIEKKIQLPRNASATLDILRMLLKIQSTHHDVASKLIASKEDLEALASQDEPDIPAMHGWRFEVFGQYARALKEGRLAIGLKDGKITQFEVSESLSLYNE